MKIGYPCINRMLACRGNKTFRLKFYSEARLVETVRNNLDCLLAVLRFNADHNILFFRITSDLVPFASHPVCAFDWRTFFKKEFAGIGRFIRRHKIRISMHPDQFTLINSTDAGVFRNSVRELQYHADVLDLLQLDLTAKIQVHIGGVYGDKKTAMRRFAARFGELDRRIRRRLVVENDDRCYTLGDCLRLSQQTGAPILFDVFHHACNSSGESLGRALKLVGETWRKRDGLPMADFSLQASGERKGKHAETLRVAEFRKFLRQSKPFDFDVMLEIKDKERSAVRAVRMALRDPRFGRVLK